MTNSKNKILNNLKNTYCRLKPSEIEGVGVFAIRDIPEKTNPFKGSPKQKWVKLKIEELAPLGEEILGLIDSFFVIRKNKTVYISENALNGMDISYFLNNSKKPNVKTIDDGTNIKKIKRGEELTVAYSTYDEKYE